MEDLIISQSDIKKWRHCQQEYHYSEVMNLEPRITKIALLRGTIIHEMIASHALGDDWEVTLAKYEKEYAKLFREEKEEFGDLPTELRRMMKGYIRHWKE